MVLKEVGRALELMDIGLPIPRAGQALVRVRACGVCRTDLHICDGELPRKKMPVILGHEVVGEVVSLAAQVTGLQVGQRVGIPWLGHTCGNCVYCQRGQENLCDRATFTGYHVDGGFAEYVVADARFCLPLPAEYNDAEAAPLLCAGLIGYRALRMAGEAQRLGIYGFGAAAHIITQVARHLGREVYAFTRPGDRAGQDFARECGAHWAGGSDQTPPVSLDAAVLFAPVGALVPAALSAVGKGGTVVCAGIHMSDIPAFPYTLLWGERAVRSVANLTRQDGVDFLALAPQVPVHSAVETFALQEANSAIDRLRSGEVRGAAVLVI
jgi:propanol-preferring alcohol dehydrogenase